MENEKKKLKTMIISMSIVLCIFILAGVVLTFVLKSKKGNLDTLNKQNYELAQELDESQKENDYYFNPDGSYTDDYKNDYFEREKGYGKDGDKKIDIVDDDNNNN